MSMTPDEERYWINQWITETSFDEELVGVPPLEPEDDDED
jgi:hypothetical protein